MPSTADKEQQGGENITLMDNDTPAQDADSSPDRDPEKGENEIEEKEKLRNGDAVEDEGMGSLIIPPPKPRSMCRRCCYIIIGIFLLLVLASAIVVLTFLILRVGGQQPQVTTSCGKVQGTYNINKQYFSFMGIPYAMPPVKKRRWRPPVPYSPVNASCWDGVWKADALRSQCVQMDVYSGTPIGSENCLYLDVYTPVLGVEAKLPVMVWIHGSDFDTGNSSVPGFSPTPDLAKDFKVVFVSIQYRLNAFGFLVLAELPEGRGNYGFLDQVEALKWVKENIASFGGNPDDVTIFGQGCGGSSVLAHLVSPESQGLFHKAWASSPPVVIDSTLESAAQRNTFFLNKTGCNHSNDTHHCLYSLSPSDVIKGIYPGWSHPQLYGLPTSHEKASSHLVIDGNVIPANFLEAFGSSTVMDVPLMIGSTAQEVDIYPQPQNIGSKDNASYIHQVAEHLDTFKDANLSTDALSLYPFQPDMAEKDKGGEYPYTSMVSDLRVNCPIDRVAEVISMSFKSPVYRYIINTIPSSAMHGTRTYYDAKYSFHQLDLFAFFDSLYMFFNTESSTSADEAFSDNFKKNVMSFVKSGKPSDTRWSVFTDCTAVVNQTTAITQRYHPEQCSLWLDHDMFSYGWRA